jgi:hypothetical protein
MRIGQGIRVFERANWQRKARTPTWLRRAESEKRPASVPERKVTEKW